MEVMTAGSTPHQVEDAGLRPVLKWAGGKRSIMDEILQRTPTRFDRYVEPFLGGGAVLFEIAPQRALANDLNEELINLYEVIRRHPELLVMQIQVWSQLVSSDFYYEIRSWDRDEHWLGSVSTVQRAARTIFLNRAGFNGLFRVNGKGQFNVPFGKNPSASLIDPSLIFRISRYLSSADVVFSSGSYEKVIEECGEGDFIYLDPRDC